MTTIAAPTRFVYENSDEPLPSRCLTLRGFLALVDTLTAAGLPPGPEFQQFCDRMAQLGDAVANGKTMQHRLTQTVVYGAPGDIGSLYSASLAEFSAHAPDVLEPLHTEALAEAQRLYAPHAKAHWRVLRDRVDKSARAFEACTKLVDPAASADAVVDDGHALEAWRESLVRATELEELLEPVLANAEILRGGQASGFGTSRIGLEIPVFVANTEDLHKRRLFEAWTDSAEQTPGAPLTTDMTPKPHQPSRCGRWARLAALGAQIRAAEDPTTVELISGPQPFAVKQVAPPSGPADNPKRPVWTHFDPEDEVKPRSPRTLLDSLRRRRHPEVDVLDTVLGDTDKEQDNA